MSIWYEDMFIIRFDTFKDARNNFVFSSNSLGSQFDLRMLNATDDRGNTTQVLTQILSQMDPSLRTGIK